MTTMRTTTRAFILALGVLALLAGNFGQSREVHAGGAMSQWYGPDANGCYSYGDGFSFTVASCPRADGAFDIYVASNGQWIWTSMAGWDINGCYFVWDGFQYLAYECQSVVQSGQPGFPAPTYTVGGSSLEPDVSITNGSTGTGTITIGGDSLPATGSWSTTGISELDAYMADSNYRNAMIWIAGTCIEIEDGVCYY